MEWLSSRPNGEITPDNICILKTCPKNGYACNNLTCIIYDA